MCGIFGFTFRHDNPQEALLGMGAAQVHRGPDGEGYHIDENIAMGMRRLSILDIEGGNQPFYSDDRSVVVLCNGEIYNFRELKSELEKKGYRFHTQNDVEVLPSLYKEYGIDLVKKLNGMFAISLYDCKQRKLFLIRDHVGIKPIYYATVGGELIYASEIKSIMRLNKLEKEINYSALSTYLDLMYIPRPMTPFRNLFKLGPGTYLEWHDNDFNLRKYWDPCLIPNGHQSESSYSEQVHELLKDSIRMQLNSDVPLGSFLSGGVDSSFVTAVASQLTDKDFSVFHIRWKDIPGKCDESQYANAVAERYHLEKHFHDVTDIDVVNLLPKLIYHLDEPFGDAAFIPTYYLAQIASEEVTVMLNGAGGDELFGGYAHHCNHSLLKSRINKLLNRRAPALSYYDMWKGSHQRRWKRLFPWYTENVFRTPFEQKYQNNRGFDQLNAIMLNDIDFYLPDDILFLSDKMTMAASIECRVPLLDYRLVELAQSIPSSMKIKNGEKKYLFKKIAEQYLPRELLYRQKEGFGFPIELWINEYKEIYFDLLLERGFLARNGLVNAGALRNLALKQELTKKECWHYWLLVVLEIWFQLFVDEKDYDSIYEL
ncbi:MAG: asparagine synthase (glutamine-hydrolyzing) [Calditrichaeota bacterium]|nr:asparagine synthase (glutamine-hydrolyzing) [Calditrichota bacterium]